MLVCPTANAFELLERIGMAAAGVGRVFDTQQPRGTEVLIVGANLAFQVGNVEHAAAAADCANGDAAESSRASCLEVGDVPVFVDQQFIAGPTMHANTHLVRLRSRTGKHGRLFAEQFGNHRFQPVDGRIFARHVVANLGISNRFAHAGTGLGDGIAAHVKLDFGHRVMNPSEITKLDCNSRSIYRRQYDHSMPSARLWFSDRASRQLMDGWHPLRERANLVPE